MHTAVTRHCTDTSVPSCEPRYVFDEDDAGSHACASCGLRASAAPLACATRLAFFAHHSLPAPTVWDCPTHVTQRAAQGAPCHRGWMRAVTADVGA